MTASHQSGGASLYRLSAPVKEYAWGSKTLLAQLTGTQPSSTPQAEMWFGTHPTSPALLPDGTPLANLVDLPYLVKLLAAQQPLSIQAHPSLEQARVGFAAEQAAGIALSDPQRTYKDANHKPEMLVALTDFTAMVGFRPLSDAAATFEVLAELVAEQDLTAKLEALAAQLRDGQLQEVFGQLVDPAGAFRPAGGWTRRIFDAVEHVGTGDEVVANALAAAQLHPDDPGALVALLMNLTHLRPGEALFIPSGTIHAYISGLGLEVMATSDNVIRGGLTVKHIDVAELEQVVTYQPGPPPIITPSVRTISDVVVTRFTPPVTDFALTQFDLPPNATLTITAETPHIAVGTSGQGTLLCGDDSLDVVAGDGLFIPGHGGGVDIATGATGVTIFMASQP